MISRTSLAFLTVLPLLASCSSAPPPSFEPQGRIVSERTIDFSGTYHFQDLETSVRAYPKGRNELALLDPSQIREDSSVVVDHEPGRSLTLRYRTRDGQEKTETIDLTSRRFRWEEGRLIYEVPEGAKGARLGLAVDDWESRIFRMDDGRLILTDTYWEAGLGFLVVPFREKRKTIVELTPSSSSTARPPSAAPSASRR